MEEGREDGEVEGERSELGGIQERVDSRWFRYLKQIKRSGGFSDLLIERRGEIRESESLQFRPPSSRKRDLATARSIQLPPPGKAQVL